MAVASLMPVSIVVCTCGAFFARRELWDLLTLVGILCNEILAQTLKRVVEEPRPPSCAAVDFCKTYGMPSSHAQLATFAATLATLHLRRRRAGCLPTAAAAGTSPGRLDDPLSALLVGLTWPVAAAVGMSRVYLGYHSQAQVLVGSVVGVAFGCLWHHSVCCGCARAFEGRRCEDDGGGGLTGFVLTFVGMRDSSLIADPLAVERMAIRDAIKKTMKKTK